MSIAFRADAEVVNGTAGTSVTVSKPAGTANGDFLIAFIAEVGAGSITPPAGWTLIGSAASGTDVTEAAYYKVAASEGASWTWTLGASVRNTGWVGAYTGVNTTTPVAFSVSSTTFLSASNTTPTTGRFSGLPLWWAVIGAAATRTASGSATTWGSNTLLSERLDGSTNGGAGTDIASVVGDFELPSEYLGQSLGVATGSQAQTACCSWAVLLRPAMDAYDGGLIEPIAEAEINGVWTDISAYVLNSPPVTITKGRSNSAGVAAPTRITCALDNADGRFTEDNPTGAYYPNFRPGVRLRISVPYGYTGTTERATAYIDSIEPDWDTSTRHAIVNIVASGRLRRLQRGADQLLPALQRSIGNSGTIGTAPAAYWTFQDGQNATQAASAVGGTPLAVSGLTFAADSTLAGSGPLPTLATGATISGAVAPHANAGQWLFGVFYKVPTSPAADTLLFHLDTTGTARIWQVRLIAGSPDQLQATAFDIAGITMGTASVAFTESEVYGQWAQFVLGVATDGSDVEFTVFVNNGVGTGTSGTLTNQTHGIVTGWSLFTGAAAGLNGAGIGHAYLISHADFNPGSDFLYFSAAMDGHTPETAVTRAVRLAAEEDEPLQTIVGGIDTNIGMGPQPATTFIAALREGEELDRGLLHDGGPSGDLIWITRSSRYNLDVRMTLDKAAGQLAPPFRPVRDDAQIRNDWTITRSGGSSARYQDDASVASHGRYKDSRTLNLAADTHLRDLAAWRVGEGTATAKRYPIIAGDLRASPELVEDWLNSRVGARIKVTNLMSQHPASIDADVMIEGYTEIISTDQWKFGLNSSPYAPYRVAVFDNDDLGKADTGGTELMIARSTSDTSFTVHTQVSPKWTTDSGEMPIPLSVTGEVLSCTAIANVTPSFVAAGTAVGGDNISLTPGLPAGLAAGDLLLLATAIRNSGTGTPNSPGADWELLLDMSNARLWGKYAASGETAPSVTFTGGAAGTTTTAQTAAVRGVGLTIHNSSAQLNSSAQNIAYPALLVGRDNCLVIVWGWKQDDWGSVATLGGMTEIGEAVSTGGDDQAFVWDYVLQSAATNIAAGSFTVTGGTSQISRGGVLALASDVQTMTVTRSVNGVSKAQAVRAAINVHEPARIAL